MPVNNEIRLRELCKKDSYMVTNPAYMCSSGLDLGKFDFLVVDSLASV
jgi:hypothetical protein